MKPLKSHMATFSVCLEARVWAGNWNAYGARMERKQEWNASGRRVNIRHDEKSVSMDSIQVLCSVVMQCVVVYCDVVQPAIMFYRVYDNRISDWEEYR